MEKKYINWSDFAAKSSILSVSIAILAITIGSPFYLGNKIDNCRIELRNEFRQDMNEFRQEIKDFHGRLCAIEERNRK